MDPGQKPSWHWEYYFYLFILFDLKDKESYIWEGKKKKGNNQSKEPKWAFSSESKFTETFMEVYKTCTVCLRDFSNHLGKHGR